MENIIEIQQKGPLNIAFLWVLLCILVAVNAFAGKDMAKGLASFKVSSVYSPYRVYEIKAEVGGRIISRGTQEGQILPAGTPLVRIDMSSLRSQARELLDMLRDLKEEEGVLEEMVELRKKKYHRYMGLYEKKRIAAQTLEDARIEFLSTRLSLIQNRKQQAEVRSNLLAMQDKIKKAAPYFSLPLYCATYYVEEFESVLPGERLARLMDVSRAKVHIDLSPERFKSLLDSFKGKKRISFVLIDHASRRYPLSGHIERLRTDPDTDYLYSYSLDLVFPPMEGLLWGEVVTVEFQPVSNR